MEVKIIDNKLNDNKIAFFPETLKSMEVNDFTIDIISEIKNGTSETNICELFNISNKEFIKLIGKLDILAYNKLKSDRNLGNIDNKKNLSRLVIHISNCCNLRCRYCYADGGNYNTKGGIINKRVVDRVFKKFSLNYENNGEIGVQNEVSCKIFKGMSLEILKNISK